MKGASKSDPVHERPAAAMGSVSSEEQEFANRRAELDRRSVHRMNKVAQMLSDTTHYITDWTHPCLNRKGEQLNVTEYYPEKKIAIDKFWNDEQYDAALCEFKRTALKKHNVRYGYLTPDRGLADLYIDLGM